MIAIDTNILVYASVPGFTEHDAARSRLESILAGPVQHCVTWVNVYEYLRVVTHPRLIRPAPMRLDHALANIGQLRGQRRVTRIDPGPEHLEHFRRVCESACPVYGNFVHDCRIAAIPREHGVDRILTQDTSFRRIPGLRVIGLLDPV